MIAGAAELGCSTGELRLEGARQTSGSCTARRERSRCCSCAISARRQFRRSATFRLDAMLPELSRPPPPVHGQGPELAIAPLPSARCIAPPGHRPRCDRQRRNAIENSDRCNDHCRKLGAWRWSSGPGPRRAPGGSRRGRADGACRGGGCAAAARRDRSSSELIARLCEHPAGRTCASEPHRHRRARASSSTTGAALAVPSNLRRTEPAGDAPHRPDRAPAITPDRFPRPVPRRRARCQAGVS